MGGCVVNYMEVIGLSKVVDGKINGVEVKDFVEGEVFFIFVKLVVNVIGVFFDMILKMD